MSAVRGVGMATSLRRAKAPGIGPPSGSGSALRLISAARRTGYVPPMRPPRRDDALSPPRSRSPSLVQVLVAPIAPRAVGVLIALATTVPIAWRRTYPPPRRSPGRCSGHPHRRLPRPRLRRRVPALLLARRPRRRTTAASIGRLRVRARHRRDRHDAEPPGRLRVRRRRLRRRRARRSVGRARPPPARAGRAAARPHRPPRARARARPPTSPSTRSGRGSRASCTTSSPTALSVIAIQSDAAEAALDKDPELARAPLHAIRASAGEALGEMRRLLGVLREDQDGNELTPQPGLAQLRALIERARGAGVTVDARVDRRAARAARQPRPLRLPDRPGGADQRPQARARRARHGRARVGAARLRLRVPTAARAPTARRPATATASSACASA